MGKLVLLRLYRWKVSLLHLGWRRVLLLLHLVAHGGAWLAWEGRKRLLLDLLLYPGRRSQLLQLRLRPLWRGLLDSGRRVHLIPTWHRRKSRWKLGRVMDRGSRRV